MTYYAVVFEFSGDGNHKLVCILECDNFKNIYDAAKRECKAECYIRGNFYFALFFRGESAMERYFKVRTIPATAYIADFAFAEIQCTKMWNSQRFVLRRY